MENIFQEVIKSLNIRQKEYLVVLNESKDRYFIYFYKNNEIIYLIDLTSLYKATLVLDIKTLSDICILVLRSRGLI